MKTCLVLALSLAVAVSSQAGQQPAAPAPRQLDVIYVPTPAEVVAKMLSMARVGPGDVVYDLGSGDGRIVIAAVRDFGAARGIGLEIDPQRLREANDNARSAGVTDRVQFRDEDLFAADLSEATVVTMYLLPMINARLYPKLRALKPGTRIVSHNYDISPEWKPDMKVVVGRSVAYLFTVPKR
jgi:tRNA A58 N-methylase Trm61